jgi:hypothetical protein
MQSHDSTSLVVINMTRFTILQGLPGKSYRNLEIHRWTVTTLFRTQFNICEIQTNC